MAVRVLGWVAQSVASMLSSCNFRDHVHQKRAQHYSTCQAIEVAHQVLHPTTHLLFTGYKTTDVFGRGGCRERVLSGVRREGKLDEPRAVAEGDCEQKKKGGRDELDA